MCKHNATISLEVDVPANLPQGKRMQLSEKQEKKTSQVLVIMLNIKVHNSAIRKKTEQV